MPSPHYQRVLEQDQQLIAPFRWFTRAMSSWWTIGLLGVPIVFYVWMAHYTIGGRYLWQHRLIDATQQQVVNWWPLQAACITLALVILWAAFRRLPMNRDSLGRFVTVMGLAIVLVSQSWAFRYQKTGVIAVPVAERESADPDPLSLTYTTRYGDPGQRELVLMVAGTQPIPVSLDGLPRWNDAAGDKLPDMRLHDAPNLQPMLSFRVRITPTAYLADGELEENEDGKQTATPTPTASRNTTTLPYPANALLAITFEVEPEQGQAESTTVWVPFEPESTESLVPKRFYQIEGLGSVGLSFRPVARKLPFAVAGTTPDRMGQNKYSELNLYAADADNDGRLVQPQEMSFSSIGAMTHRYQAINVDGDLESMTLNWLNPGWQVETALISASKKSSNPFILAGIVTFLLGVALDFLMGWFGSLLAYKRSPNAQAKATASKPENPA